VSAFLREGFCDGQKILSSLGSSVPDLPVTDVERAHFFAWGESAFTVGSELVIDGGMSNL
jgi:hypothetical protein